MSFVNRLSSGKSTTQNPTKILSTLPKHILAGYWHNWQASPAAIIPLREVIDHFDVINIAFATASDSGDGKIVFTPHVDPEQFQSDIVYLQSLGKKIVISIGGATGSISIDNFAAQNNFSDSVTKIVQQYGFDGIDINLEGKVILDKGDTDFKNPISPSIKHLTAAIRAIKNRFGSDFILSLAPETINVQGGFRSYARFSGSYLPVIHELRDILTYLQVQHYNSNVLAARNGNTYVPGTADFHVAMADMLLRGFPVQGDPNNIFPPLMPEQIVIGLAAWPSAVNGGYTSPVEVKKALNYLARGESFGGDYCLHDSVNYAAFRGVMTWSINWDAANQHEFSNAIRFCLDALP